MKINMVQKTIEVKYYVAEDGTVFQTERECREYEQDFDRIDLVHRYNAIPMRTYSAEYITFLPCMYRSDDIVHIMRVRDQEDLNTLNEWFSRERIIYYRNELKAEDIGKVIVLVYTDDYDRDYEESNNIDCYFLDVLIDNACCQAYQLRAEL